MASARNSGVNYREQSIALQLGTYSNYIGSHLWNMRDDVASPGDYDYNQLYRVSKSSSNSNTSDYGEAVVEGTYCPRALFFDTADNIGRKHPLGRPENLAVTQNARQQSCGGAKAEKGLAWGGATTTIVRGSTDSDFDLNAQYWSDFLEPHVNINPKTLCQLPQWMNSQSFDLFSQGRGQEMLSADCREEYFDRFRYFSEECDFLRGINVHCDAYSGYSGLAASLVEGLSDDFGSASVLLWAVTEPLARRSTDEKNKNTRKMMNLNIPLLFSAVYDMVAVIFPINPMAVTKSTMAVNTSEGDALYDSAAVVACAVETLTSHQHLSDYGNFNRCGREWLHAVTGGGRFKFLDVEMSALTARMDFLEASRVLLMNREAATGRGRVRVSKPGAVNPFSKLSLSPAAYAGNSEYAHGAGVGQREARNNLHNDNTSDNEGEDDGEAKTRILDSSIVRTYVNSVASRTVKSSFVDFVALQQAYGSSGVMLSHLHQYSVPLFTSNGFAGLESISSEDNSFASAVAATASSLTGDYLKSVAASFSDNYKRIDEAALKTADLDAESLRESEERLYEIVGRYER